MRVRFNENITIIVNNKAISVKGDILGMNWFEYHTSPLILTKTKRLKIPNKNGIPK